MTESDNTLSVEIYDSYRVLKRSVDALACAAYLVPEGGEDEALGHLFRALASTLEADLTAHMNTLLRPRS